MPATMTGESPLKNENWKLLSWGLKIRKLSGIRNRFTIRTSRWIRIPRFPSFEVLQLSELSSDVWLKKLQLAQELRTNPENKTLFIKLSWLILIISLTSFYLHFVLTKVWKSQRKLKLALRYNWRRVKHFLKIVFFVYRSILVEWTIVRQPQDIL